MEFTRLVILGSTGSIGQNALSVVAEQAGAIQVVALTAQSSWEKLFEQCYHFRPHYAVISDPTYFSALRDKIQSHSLPTVVLSGSEALSMVAQLPEVDHVLAGIVGAAGLLPTLAAVQAGKRVLLANKEALVMSGECLMAAAKRSKATILPVDSEHNALFQCMPAGYQTGTTPVDVSKLILTASGGPFLHFSAKECERVTPEMACCHPNWTMGKKITVDCATLMNKGLELIEASYLFQCELDRLEAVIHPQSVIHSLVEYTDGSMLAQLGSSDMRIPIAYCLGWPQRIASGAKRLSLTEIGTLTFYPPDPQQFPCWRLAREALIVKNAAPTVLNASNEVAVQAFLAGKIRFTDIAVVVESVMNKLNNIPLSTIEAILSMDAWARKEAMRVAAKREQYV